ncbi:RluA family pseudouridine synthase [Herbaspirillum sp. RTI4]|uniref:RluA family pseudouridine synthase n=1 Tax=Herbaspirillum sp. RTI4 TaxID=3048640 RepID=UPI002AB48B68|nr:RluA family pseudouridine synthase [Herbaspirillum sp. RTI4]MDY7578562.1 RluA family pseudouridine synthase [Herbaspirillum sp. RTI4]MEA9981132.1 RluA family pseudouridine synthase [Herbaspirillum sp. RTI4]
MEQTPDAHPEPEFDIEPIHVQFTDDDCGTRLDKALSALLPQYSRGRIQQWIEEGQVTVDGATAKIRMIVLGDEKVQILPQPAPDEQAFTPEDIPLDIVYEDAAILVVNKPAGLVVHPGAGNWSGTLLNGLLHYCPSLVGVPRAGIVHRLDKDTSGLMVVGKTLVSQTDLVRQLQARTVKRQYLSLVWGTPQLSGTIDASIARHPRDRIKMGVSESLSAKPAITHYERLAGGLLDRRSVSLMHCKLETGRTHQIRVHMQSLGFALVGDALYGKTHLTSAFDRQALQAWRLGLIHPTTGEQCEWTVPLADDFLELLERAGIDIDEALASHI